MRGDDTLRALRLASRLVWRDLGALLLLVGAGLVYAFFYPLPYSQEQVRRVPVAVVDADRSALSRQLVRLAQASPRLEVVLVTPHETEARQALLRGQVQGLLIVPAHLEREVWRGQAVALPVQGNGAYLLMDKLVLKGFAEAVGTASAGIELARRQAAGATPERALLERAPVRLQAHALFNTREGYASYIVPAVAVLILQQTLAIGTAMLVGSWVERGGARLRWFTRRADRAVALWVLLVLLGVLNGVFYFGFVFWFWDLPRGGGGLGPWLLLPVFASACAALGVVLGAWAARRERVFMLWVGSSMPLVFISGVPWPTQALPAPVQWLAALSPSTPGIRAFVAMNQMDATLAEVMPQLLHLTALAGLYLLLAVGMALWRKARA